MKEERDRTISRARERNRERGCNTSGAESERGCARVRGKGMREESGKEEEKEERTDLSMEIGPRRVPSVDATGAFGCRAKVFVRVICRATTSRNV